MTIDRNRNSRSFTSPPDGASAPSEREASPSPKSGARPGTSRRQATDTAKKTDKPTRAAKKPRQRAPARTTGQTGRTRKAPSPKQTAQTRRPPKQAREADIEKQLSFEIEHLRSLANQIATRHLELLESEIVQIRETVMASRGHHGRLHWLELMLQAFEGLKVKPDKGRRKDLQRVADLVALLNRLAQKL